MNRDALIAEATAAGFDLCKVSRCTVPPHAAEFRTWLREGCAGEMTWLERNPDRRTDPSAVLPGVRSVIVLAKNYWQEESPVAPDPVASRGRIARYAWGDDYHDVMQAGLARLDSFLIAHGGQQKCYVDTGPVLERDFAALSGLGWQGKSTMLINAKLGTWFFLAAILTTLELKADAPEPSRCGRCTRCLDQCPTGAITAPYHLDARRCISYLTIELKGSIPIELRPLIGDRIYGCDDCLTACPWNRFATAAHESAFAARPATTGMSLADYLALDEAGFRALFRRSPIKRIKRRGFLRNVCVALGNIGSRSDLPALERAATDAEPLIREHAVWAIERINEREEQRSPRVS